MKDIVLFGGSFNPFTVLHRDIAEVSLEFGHELIVMPCGLRPDKVTTNNIEPGHRAEIIRRSMKGTCNRRARLDFSDLFRERFTTTYELQERLAKSGRIWHVVGGDLIHGGGRLASPIQTWHRGLEVWENFYFLVIVRNGYDFFESDLPPHCQVIKLSSEKIVSSDMVRKRIKAGESITGLVMPEAEAYIERFGLYR